MWARSSAPATCACPVSIHVTHDSPCPLPTTTPPPVRVASLHAQITFKGEEGVDAGGLFAEYMDQIAHAAALASAPTLFSDTTDGSLIPTKRPALDVWLSKGRETITSQMKDWARHASSSNAPSEDKGAVAAEWTTEFEAEVMAAAKLLADLPSKMPLMEKAANLAAQGVPSFPLTDRSLAALRQNVNFQATFLQWMEQAEDEQRRVQLFAIGRLIALAVIRRTPFPLALSRFVFKLMLGESITASDVARVDPEFAKWRVHAVLAPGGVAAVEELLCDELYFVATPMEGQEELELCPGGKGKRVSEENKAEYIELLVEHHLIGHARREVSLLVEGFRDIIPLATLQGMGLRAIDLELLVCGLPSLDLDEWRGLTTGELMSDPKHEQLRGWVWEVVAGMGEEERGKLFSFTCGSSRLPAEGFKSLRPPFRVEVLGEPEQLPSAHTCFNELDLPPYPSKAALASKLHIAIEAGGGFGFM